MAWMDGQKLPAELSGSEAWSPRFECDDVDETRSYVTKFLCEHTLDHKAPNRPPLFRHRGARLGPLSVHELEYAMHEGFAGIVAPDIPDFYIFELNLKGAAELSFGGDDYAFHEGHLVVANSGRTHTKCWLSDGREIFVRIDRRMLHDTVAEMIDGPLIEPVLFDRAPTPVDRSTAALVRYLSFICADLDEGAEGMARTFASVNAAKLFLELLVRSVRNNYTERLERHAEPLMPGHVKRAVGFIEANALEAIDLDQIVASAGVRPRTLYEGFARYCGTSPIAYLRAVRLDIARERLREAARDGSSVTEVALACGFEHLGKFAQLYRARFGELPSETLKRHN